MTSLCVKCGDWKQAPMSRCGCGFRPDESSTDSAKSYLLSSQFRTAEELNELAQRIRSGQQLSFGDDELKLAMTIGNWNAAVTMSFVVFAILLGLLLGGVAASLSALALGAIGLSAAVAAALAFRLMGYVDNMVARRNLTPGGTDGQ